MYSGVLLRPPFMSWRIFTFIVIIRTLIWDSDFNYSKHIAHENEKEERTLPFSCIFSSVLMSKHSFLVGIHGFSILLFIPWFKNLQFPLQIWNLCQCIHETFPMIKSDRHWIQTHPFSYYPEIWLDFGSSDLQIQDLFDSIFVIHCFEFWTKNFNKCFS